jgi:pimeloyl-ACP methyl ester carboxylesterase
MRLVSILLLASLSPAAVKIIPPPGIAVPASDRAELESGLAQLGRSLDAIQKNPLWPDVAVYHKAVRFALEGNEFFKPAEIAAAKKMLQEGQARADALAHNTAPWTSATGLVVRGYVSKIDGSVQPYGLVVPPSFSPDRPHHWRLDAWFHGRNETLSEVAFIADREKNMGEFTPRDTIVVHLYGRYCNANKFAGEVDLFEALADVKRHYSIDEKRILVRGFSMGGAAVWHIAAHHAGEWAAAAPGAGFAETKEFVPAYHKEQITPTWFEEKLWHLTNATDYALNFAQLPLVAYNGEIDPQQQAADIMARYLGEEGMHLTRVVGPKTAHKYHPDSKVEINNLIDPIADRGTDFYPRKIHFTTWTLAYNKMKWVTVDGLEKHWDRARVDADITDDHTITAQTRNVSGLTFNFGSGGSTFDETKKATVILDGQRLTAAGPATDRSWTAHFHKAAGKWAEGEETGLRKRHNLQGPIDDAFLDSFIMVKPTGTPLAPGIAPWVANEETRAVHVWRTIFRGEARERDDSAITDADIASSNLILWGDPGSNKILARIADKLPVKWTAAGVTAGAKQYPAASSAVVMIYPNPLNPKKYVVLNSGFTFRESANASNALQNATLPDYAIVDTTTPADEKWPGKLADVGFFGEKWELLANGGR